MKKIIVSRYRQRLDHLFKQIGGFSEDIEMQAHWAQYICVLVSGFLEISVRSIYSEYAYTKAEHKVANFVENELKSFQNPKMEKILELTRSFSPEWEKFLREKTEGELKDAVDSIVANRNRIAHGEDVGITYHRIKGYYQDAIKVIELIDNQCNK